MRGTSGILNCALLRGYEAGLLDSNGWYLVVLSQYQAVPDMNESCQTNYTTRPEFYSKHHAAERWDLEYFRGV